MVLWDVADSMMIFVHHFNQNLLINKWYWIYSKLIIKVLSLQRLKIHLKTSNVKTHPAMSLRFPVSYCVSLCLFFIFFSFFNCCDLWYVFTMIDLFALQGHRRDEHMTCEGQTLVIPMSKFTYAYLCRPINIFLSGWRDQDRARGVFYRAAGEGGWGDRKRGGRRRRRPGARRLSLLSCEEITHQQSSGGPSLQRLVCDSCPAARYILLWSLHPSLIRHMWTLWHTLFMQKKKSITLKRIST